MFTWTSIAVFSLFCRFGLSSSIIVPISSPLHVPSLQKYIRHYHCVMFKLLASDPLITAIIMLAKPYAVSLC
jgi:hypothetical protein